jgi:hypothetical protein
MAIWRNFNGLTWKQAWRGSIIIYP